MIRGKPVRTTVSNKAAPCPLDHVNRQFHAPAPNMRWVSDFTMSRPERGSFYATREWMDWFNNRRLLKPISNITTAEAEQRFYAMPDDVFIAV